MSGGPAFGRSCDARLVWGQPGDTGAPLCRLCASAWRPLPGDGATRRVNQK